MTQWWSSRQADSDAAGDDELRMIPVWSMVLAASLFVGMQYIFHVVMPHHKHELLPLRLMMGYAWGTLWASYALLLGYVSRDVKRRGMSPGLWMLVCVVLPGGIGAVVYFMLRQPILSRCPTAPLRWTPTTTSAHSASSRWRPSAAPAIAASRSPTPTAPSAATISPPTAPPSGCASTATANKLPALD